MTDLIQRKARPSLLRDAWRMLPSPTPLSLRVIRAEHEALASMLRTVPLLVQAQRLHGTSPGFEALRAMLFYVDEFPERLHHKKESELLFPKLRARVPQLRDTLDDLEADHAQGERAVRELQHSLLAWEQMGDCRRDKFEQQLQVYSARYLRHMRREETEVLPRAAEVLTADDWAELDEAFGSHRDPLAPQPGQPVDAAYASLRERILAALPAPFGWAATTVS
ncbi:hemerythrin domain-containing protein [Roseateles cellulosilyticus]|uniref:Hemerythrin domain-containing protein n=1 Tax=Pelomonas cellulosilytica TaxID=2906762 RepID=A0ABS8XTR4_9BURK|nr:hemerythrin domain-containing protein [Pelomonas sp. P8]MCE4554001.1 hemerythrin domain-containing protein [Pelomonas sp. P8]